jgi:hypothetical protein
VRVVGHSEGVWNRAAEDGDEGVDGDRAVQFDAAGQASSASWRAASQRKTWMSTGQQAGAAGLRDSCRRAGSKLSKERAP